MTAKTHSMYVHPWDVFDEGPARILKYLSKTGIDTVNIAVSYHAGRFILPHNPVNRVYHAEEGVVYFQPKKEFFGNSELKPAKSNTYLERDVLAELQAAAVEYGIRVNAWAVILHNGRLSKLHEKFSVIDPYGRKNFNYLCMNRPEVREYVASLAESILSYPQVDSIQLEAAAYPNGISHGNHHEVFGVRLDDVISYLYSMCYCRYCTEKAREMGYNMAKLTEEVKNILDFRLNSLAGVKVANLEKELENLDMYDIAELKRRNVMEHFNELTERLNAGFPGKRIEVVSGGETYANEGYDLSNMPKGIDMLNLTEYYPDGSQIISKSKEVLSKLRDTVPFMPSVRINHPMVTSSGQLGKTIEMLEMLEIAGINFYNYGWTSQALLDELRDAL